MPVIHFEEADSPERTRIGEGIVKFARQADRLETGRAEGKYFLNHADGCGAGSEGIGAGEEFFFDTDTGEILCADHGRARKEECDAEAREKEREK
ncbi:MULTISPECIES: hypothetical protein [Halorussus]|uniref:hypothetical protein n=1 Tax=Halorussus TaxID=1070314 RepID=UPI000E21AE87|nr:MULTISPECIES: hypothetical protein [Halorussus]NHN59597.1 hypothetical protein [Halorussus sp. JP-T4]